MLDKEKIVCSAVLVDLKEEQVVLCGLRHSDCIQAMIKLGFSMKETRALESGFLTTNNRFVDRTEGFAIAKDNIQILPDSRIIEGTLFSENIY
jgi:hypothetical protein